MIKYRLKKVFAFFVMLTIITSSFFELPSDIGSIRVSASQKEKWPTAPSLVGESAILIEASTGTVLYEKKGNKKMYPASITKIMTALLTIENCDLNETIEYSEYAINSLEFEDANAGCQIGEKMTVKDALYALMLTSANEAATALGEHIAGSTQKFADMMNERAKQAGATGTHFKNANGLHDPDHYVTAYGMAMIMRDALKYQTFRDIINTVQYTIKKNNKRKEDFVSIQRHKMVKPYSGFYYEGIIGGKTGFTDQSGTTLVTAAQRNGMTLITVVLKSNGDNVYKDTTALMDYGFKNFELKNVAESDKKFENTNSGNLKSPFTSSNHSIYIDPEADIVIPKKVKVSDLTTEISYNLTKDSFASIIYKYGDKQLGEAKIKYQNVASNTNSDTETSAAIETSAQSIEKLTTNSDTENIATTKTKNTYSKKTTFKIPKIVLPIILGVIVFIIILVLLLLHRRKLNKIRTMKRQRSR